MDFESWLKALADGGGSDLYLTTGAPPSAKFDGELRPLAEERLSPGFTRDLAYELMDAQQAREFDEKLEMNLAISLAGVGRFRVNIFKQRNEVGMVKDADTPTSGEPSKPEPKSTCFYAKFCVCHQPFLRGFVSKLQTCLRRAFIKGTTLLQALQMGMIVLRFES